MLTIRNRDARFIMLMATALLASWSAQADPIDDFAVRYSAITSEARSVWQKSRLQQPTISEKRLRLQIEILNLNERTSRLAEALQTFHAGYLQDQLESKVLSKPQEQLVSLSNRTQLLAAWLSLLSAYFEISRPIYLQAATQTYNTWEMLEKLR